MKAKILMVIQAPGVYAKVTVSLATSDQDPNDQTPTEQIPMPESLQGIKMPEFQLIIKLEI